jgi:hypothetical protein
MDAHRLPTGSVASSSTAALAMRSGVGPRSSSSGSTTVRAGFGSSASSSSSSSGG